MKIFFIFIVIWRKILISIQNIYLILVKVSVELRKCLRTLQKLIIVEIRPRTLEKP